MPKPYICAILGMRASFCGALIALCSSAPAQADCISRLKTPKKANTGTTPLDVPAFERACTSLVRSSTNYVATSGLSAACPAVSAEHSSCRSKARGDA